MVAIPFFYQRWVIPQSVMVETLKRVEAHRSFQALRLHHCLVPWGATRRCLILVLTEELPKSALD